MKFETAMESMLRHGKAVRRAGWDNKEKCMYVNDPFVITHPVGAWDIDPSLMSEDVLREDWECCRKPSDD